MQKERKEEKGKGKGKERREIQSRKYKNTKQRENSFILLVLGQLAVRSQIVAEMCRKMSTHCAVTLKEGKFYNRDY